MYETEMEKLWKYKIRLRLSLSSLAETDKQRRLFHDYLSFLARWTTIFYYSAIKIMTTYFIASLVSAVEQ